MDAFISRKRKRVASPQKNCSSASQKNVSRSIEEQEDSTDIKLTILASVAPVASNEDLLDLLISCDGCVKTASAVLICEGRQSVSPRRKSSLRGLQSSLPFTTYNDNLLPKSSKAPKPLTRKGRTLHLFTPADIEAHTPCSIIHNFLPTEEATSLLEELLTEATTLPRATFKLFDNVVQPRHSACLYVNSLEEREKQRASTPTTVAIFQMCVNFSQK